ncbi:MAG: hypothetical protein M3N15_06425 [Actinomycetota bacterium]|nr:hypothetical protein [Actinomycetota bacterium]
MVWWRPGEILADPRYTVNEVDVLAARAKPGLPRVLPDRQLLVVSWSSHWASTGTWALNRRTLSSSRL